MDTKAETPPAPFPSSGTGFGVDYDLVKKQFNVPIVSKDMLLQRGGNYITKYIPPTITMNDKSEYVLVAHSVKDLYHVDQLGVAVVKTDDHNKPYFPPVPYTAETAFQDTIYHLVETSILARKGLMSQMGKVPSLGFSTSTDKSQVDYMVLSPSMVKDMGLPSAGQFMMPRNTPTSPYPLKLKHESMAIPPKLPKNDGLESATGDPPSGWKMFLVVFLLVMGLLMSYFLVKDLNKGVKPKKIFGINLRDPVFLADGPEEFQEFRERNKQIRERL